MSAYRVLHITDLHLRAEGAGPLLDIDTDHSLAAVLDAALGAHETHALLITGDIAHDPETPVYARARALVAAKYSGPTLWLPGNHDLAEPMRALGPGAARQDTLAPVLRLGPWHVLGLDRHADEQVSSRITPAARAALEDACRAAGEAPVLLATHHPPIPIGCPWLDKDRIQSAHELLEWCAEHSNLKAMVFGHAHQRLAARHTSAHGSVALYGTPSTCFQFAPNSTSFGIDAGVAPGYRWLLLDDSGGVSTRAHYLDAYP